MSILSGVWGDPNAKQLKKLKPVVEKINALEKKCERLLDATIKSEIKRLRQSLDKRDLDDILPEVFALTREAAKRTIGQRHFDVQILAGLALHQAKIAEMKTGEGKTLASTLAIALNALAGKGVHVITVNDYLARRDVNWMGPIYHRLGLSVACLQHEKAYLFEPQTKPDNDETTIEYQNLQAITRPQAYQADIVYGTNSEFGFDYLRDNLAGDLEQIAQNDISQAMAVIDEIDSVLIDEARTPLIISVPDEQSSKMYEQFAQIVPRLKQDQDFTLDEKRRSACLTEKGLRKMEKILDQGNIYQSKTVRLVHHLEQALKAQFLFHKDKHYVVNNHQVIIVDDFTGRLMPGRRFSGGLHQALEAKEGVLVQEESRTLASITLQNYFRLYGKLSGMTGTALTSAEEFSQVYGLDVLAVPTNKPMVRHDLSDLVYKTEAAKFQAVAEKAKQCQQAGQPVLIGTVSIAKNELLSAYLKKAGVSHQVLNAKNHEQEARIIAQAGRLAAVTLATNMAGRGVDIILGGKNVQAEQAKVKNLGGLMVLGTERHEARRIDDQLRGRAGRQGDLGASRFFVSLEDELMKIFGSERIESLMQRFNLPDDMPIENRLISKAIESAQKRVEGSNFDMRKHVLEYDDVLDKQRRAIYKKRRDILQRQSSLLAQAREIIKERGEPKAALALAKIQEKLGEPELRHFLKLVFLQSIDRLWLEHLEEMDYLRQGIGLRAYGHDDPLVSYKNEGNRMFKELLQAIDDGIVRILLTVKLESGTGMQRDERREVPVSQPISRVKIGRNQPCPCGSGKKYKKCCGK